MAPMPMSNDQALAYAHAHRDTSAGVVTATNKLRVPICRVVFLSLAHHESRVNQAGATEKSRGNLDPTEQPLLELGQDSLMMFPIVQAGASDMTVTAFGCDRTDKHLGRYVVDENKVVFQKTISLADQGKVVIAP